MTNWQTAPSYVDCPFPNDLNPKALVKSREKLKALDCFIEDSLTAKIKSDSFGKIEASLYKKPTKKESKCRVDKTRFRTTPVTFDEIREVDEETAADQVDENANKPGGPTTDNPHTLPLSELHQKPPGIQRFLNLSRSNNNLAFSSMSPDSRRLFSSGFHFLGRYLPTPGSPCPEFSGQTSQHNPIFSPDSGPFPRTFISPSDVHRFGQSRTSPDDDEHSPNDEQDSPQFKPNPESRHSLPDIKLYNPDGQNSDPSQQPSERLRSRPSALGRASSFTEGASRRKRGVLSHHKSLEILIHLPNGLLPTIPELNSPAPGQPSEPICMKSDSNESEQASSI